MAETSSNGIPSTLDLKAAGTFWLAIVLTGLGTGASAAALLLILQSVQHVMWPAEGLTLLDAATEAPPGGTSSFYWARDF